MKRFLLVLLVLGLSVPAVADVFVYNFKPSGVEFKWDDAANNGDGAWVQSKPSGMTYIVIQVTDSSSDDSVNVWEIDTWNGKDPDTGKLTKYYSVSGPDTVNFIQTPIAEKNTWILEGTLEVSDNPDKHVRVMLSGQAKSTKIGADTYTVAATLSGYGIWGDIPSQDIGGGAVSLTLSSAITKAVIAQVRTDGGDIDNADNVRTAIGEYFENTLNYQQD